MTQTVSADEVVARRDRFGQRPLYFAEIGDGLVTSESIWPLVARPDLSAAWDRDAAALALLGALPANRTLFRGIGRVPPGGALRLGHSGARLDTARPRGPERSAAPRDGPGAAAELLAALRRAVARACPDGAGCALSGGLDSAGLLALMSERDPAPRAFSLVDDASSPDELSAARELVSSCGAEHILVRVSGEELPEHAEAAVHGCEQPIWNGRAVARWLYFRGAHASGGSALLSGTGADELLCGDPVGLASVGERIGVERALARCLLSPDASPAAGDVSVGGSLAERRGLILERVLPESTLPIEVVAARAAGTEVRLPYLDDEVADLALALSPELLVRDGVGKRVLREALAGLVPPAVAGARKQPRLAPAGGGSARARRRWRELHAGWLTVRRVVALGPIEPAAVAALLAEWDRGEPGDAQHHVADAVLLRLTSLAILHETALRHGGVAAPA